MVFDDVPLVSPNDRAFNFQVFFYHLQQTRRRRPQLILITLTAFETLAEVTHDDPYGFAAGLTLGPSVQLQS